MPVPQLELGIPATTLTNALRLKSSVVCIVQNGSGNVQ